MGVIDSRQYARPAIIPEGRENRPISRPSPVSPLGPENGGLPVC